MSGWNSQRKGTFPSSMLHLPSWAHFLLLLFQVWVARSGQLLFCDWFGSLVLDLIFLLLSFTLKAFGGCFSDWFHHSWRAVPPPSKTPLCVIGGEISVFPAEWHKGNWCPGNKCINSLQCVLFLYFKVLLGEGRFKKLSNKVFGIFNHLLTIC